MAQTLNWWVQEALSEGLGPREGLRAARAGGLRTGDRAWYQAYGVTRAKYAAQAQVTDGPLNRAMPPTGTWRTVRRKGFSYRVLILLADRVTGARTTAYVTVWSRRPMSRGRAIKIGIDSWKDPDEKYPRKILAGFVANAFTVVKI